MWNLLFPDHSHKFCLKHYIYVDIFQCLSSTVALSYGSRFIAQLEQRGTGLQWDNMDFKEGGFNFSWCCYMMLIDSAVYFLLGWYLRTAFPGSNFLVLIIDSECMMLYACVVLKFSRTFQQKKVMVRQKVVMCVLYT